MNTSSLCIAFAAGLSLAAASILPASAEPAKAAKPSAAASKDSKEAAKPDAVENPLKLADDAPTSYTVVKGDTLWGISAKFLKEPFRWPEIWNMNREQVKDPHWIYPGDVIQLAFDASGKPMLLLNGKAARGNDTVSGGTQTIKPQVRLESVGGQAIPTIPASAINPFLSAPLVVSAGALASAPKIVSTEDGRVIVGGGNRAYVAGLQNGQGTKWHLYRPSKTIRDPSTNEILGHEVIYLGDARVTSFGNAATTSTIEIVRSSREINRGDRLTPATDAALPSHVPRAPTVQLKGQIASIMDGVKETGRFSIVTINLGTRDGLENGHVLASSLAGSTVNTRTVSYGPADSSRQSSIGALLTGQAAGSQDGVPVTMNTPSERNGLLYVFRVFDRVSYALVMSSSRPIAVGDMVTTP